MDEPGRDTLPPMRQKSNSVPDTKAYLTKRVDRPKPKPLQRRDTPMDFSWTQNKSKAPTTHQRSLSHDSVSEEDELTALGHHHCLAEDSHQNGAECELPICSKYVKSQNTPGCGNLQKALKVTQVSSCEVLTEDDE